jgi:hypothetical protein
LYQIDQSFTRLEPQIDFSSAAKNQTIGELCVLGDPPKLLMALHCPALINAWHERMVQALTYPTQVETRTGHRRVQVMGTAIFDFAPDGQCYAWRWTFNDYDLPALERLPDHTVVAVGVPHQALWMDGFREGALRSLMAIYPGQPSRCAHYVNWANKALIELCWTDEVQTRVRAHIADILALDRQILDIATQIQLTALPRTPMRLEEFNHVMNTSTSTRKL